ncbi:hypothetical protein FOCC_FOCC013378 [Frankliniella occidentalis]|uniref:Uncharacterized protein LOC113201998 n=1 Tax=Frankliniella occidentalis TaxID=133901 RepID=A0A6J1RTY0_FRAOC|nr:uncharacterized protein LOC113201998 [Frankliniella occidentalis]XP_026271814.1 uncharacterized protein LOC113201998 [Frankliniella occidentalis]KAE8741119.1 hypothetical protein FOCC_FOCC013378 [Frankliniella occidentalis]
MEYEGKDGPHHHTGGVKPFGIEGRFARERERLAGGFTDADRAWRSQFLKDQVLHNEPVIPEWYYKERYNPIRRFYRWPLDTLFGTKHETYETNFRKFAPRYWTGKFLMGLATAYIGYYCFKYHANDWQSHGGFDSIGRKTFRPIGSEFYNTKETLKPADYYDNRRGFNKCPI